MPNLGYTVIGGSAANLVGHRLQALLAPEDGQLDSISVYIPVDNRGGDENIRVALYSGGAGDSDPTGATLVEDLGVLPGAGTTGWRTVSSSINPTFTVGTRLWLGIKTNSGYGLQYAYTTTAVQGNFVGSWIEDITINNDETVAWPSSVPDSGTAEGSTVSFYLTYTATSGPVLTFTSGPTTANVQTTQLDIQVTTDETGTVYSVVVPNGATAPTSAEVKAGTGSGGTGQIAAGNVAATANTEATITLTGLSLGTDYDIYVVAEDDATTPNLQASPTLVDQATADSIINLTGNDALRTGNIVADNISGIEVWVIDFTSNTVISHQTGISTNSNGEISLYLVGSGLTSGDSVAVVGRHTSSGRQFNNSTTVS